MYKLCYYYLLMSEFISDLPKTATAATSRYFIGLWRNKAIKVVYETDSVCNIICILYLVDWSSIGLFHYLWWSWKYYKYSRLQNKHACLKSTQEYSISVERNYWLFYKLLLAVPGKRRCSSRKLNLYFIHIMFVCLCSVATLLVLLITPIAVYGMGRNGCLLI